MAGKTASGDGRFGSLLRHYRAAVNLTQEELAERSGLSVQAIGALERGDRRSPRPSTVELLAGALELDASQRKRFIAAARGQQAADAPSEQPGSPPPEAAAGLAAAYALLASLPVDGLPPHAVLPAGSHMPLAPNPLFVGRGEELLQIARALRGGDTTVALGQVVASTGLGGLGKTQLAVELVHRYGRFFAGGVFWLSFACADEIPLQIASCASPGMEARPLEERVRRVRDAWQSAVPRLLVFDNCEEETLLDAWRPTSGGCRVLVTSRRPYWSPTLGVTAVPLDLLPRPDGIQLLRRYRPDLAPDDPGLDALAAELGDLPLALHLAGSYLRAYQAEITLGGYLTELRQSDVVQHASLLGAGLEGSPSPTHHVQSVAQTFALCVGRLDREREVDQVAIALLARMACMAPGEPVPRDLLAGALEDVDPLLFANGLRRLRALGLVEEGDGWLQLHRLLVHFVRRERLVSDAQAAVDRWLIDCGEAAKRSDLLGPALWAVIPHLVDVAGRDVGDGRHRAAHCRAAGLALHYAGDLGGARSWLERAVEIAERALGPDDPDTAYCLDHLGVLLRDQGEFAVARRFIERALAVRERALPPDAPLIASSLHNLGFVLRSQREFGAARLAYERAVDIRWRVLGAEHPDTAESLNNLGCVLMFQDELAAARRLHERALDIRERVLGPDHPQVGYSLNNLGVLLRDQGELTAARPLLERALGIRERVLGPDHPDIAFSLNSLAILVRDQGAADAARALFERALDIRVRVLGPDHPDMAFTLHNLAALHHAQGDPAAARPLFERALAVRERVLGPDHPDAVATRRALAELAAEGDGAGAEG